MLNLGCGHSYHADWVNIDFISPGKDVLAYDLALGIPFGDEAFDIVYHSHVLEHFTREQGLFFLSECYRVLRPGGLLRLAVPDLEGVAREYLASLEAARNGEELGDERHEWMLIELLDQMVRVHPGGDMGAYWQRKHLPLEAFIMQRCGDECASYRKKCVLQGDSALPLPEKFVPLPANMDFYQSGELHRWMYDERSLSRTLHRIGYAAIRKVTHEVSSDPDVLRYGLDVTQEGKVRKPDSLFMECRKPERDAATDGRSLRIMVLCTSDGGGAGQAASRLHDGLRATGVDSEMYVAWKKNHARNVHVFPDQNPVVAMQGGRANVSWINAANKSQRNLASGYPQRDTGFEMFSDGESSSSLTTLPLADDFPIINLHWIANFVNVEASLDFLASRPVFWTLHDMRPFTGGCHYSTGCTRYMEQCGACPQLGSSDARDVSFDVWRKQMGLYRKLNLHIVAPSRWLAECAHTSSLFRKFPVHIVENGHPMHIFRPLNRMLLREKMGIAPHEFVLGFSADDLQNRRKGMQYLFACLEHLATRKSCDAIRVLLLGNNPPKTLLHAGLPIDVTGPVSRPEDMAAYYNVLDAAVLPSLEDNAPNVIIEAAACGTPTAAFAAGGIVDMISHGETGWLAPAKDAENLAKGLEWLCAHRQEPRIRQLCRVTALERWNAPVQAGKYKVLFEEALGSYNI